MENFPVPSCGLIFKVDWSQISPEMPGLVLSRGDPFSCAFSSYSLQAPMSSSDFFLETNTKHPISNRYSIQLFTMDIDEFPKLSN